MVSVSCRRVLLVVAFALVASVALLPSPVVGGPSKWCHDDCDFAYRTCGGSYKECTDAYEACNAACPAPPSFASVAEMPHEVAPTTVGDARCSQQCEAADRSCRRTYSSGTPAAIAICDDAWARCVSKCGVFQRPTAVAAAAAHELSQTKALVGASCEASCRDLANIWQIGANSATCDLVPDAWHGGDDHKMNRCYFWTRDETQKVYNQCAACCGLVYSLTHDCTVPPTPTTWPGAAASVSVAVEAPVESTPVASDRDVCYRPCAVSMSQCTVPCDRLQGDALALCVEACGMPYNSCVDACDKQFPNFASVTSATPASVGLSPCPAGTECARCQMTCLNFAKDTNACLKDCPTRATLSTTPDDETPADEAAAKAAKAACYNDCLVAWTQCLVTCTPGDAACYAKCATPSCQQQCEKPTPAPKFALASTEQVTSGRECMKECKAKSKEASDKCRKVKWVNRSACYSAIPTMVKACETGCTH